MGIPFSQIDDIVNLTQENLVKRGAFVDLQTDLQDHTAVREMWKRRKKKFEGGNDWRWDLQIDHNHSARTVGLYESDGSSVGDTMIKGIVSPRHVNAHYIYDQREKDFQRGGLAIVDYIKTKYTGMQVSLYELMEEILWGKPADASDEKTPYGIAYWVVKNAAEGFHGGNPSGFPLGCGNISSTAYERWANYTAQYATVEKTDLIRKMRRASRQVKFRSPVSHATPKLGGMGNGIYTNDRVIGLMEEVLEANNMSLGNDLASKDGRTLFKGTPITYAPYLDGDATDPVYMLDWNWLVIGVLAGWENQLTKPYQVADKHLVRRVDLDCSMQMVCSNRRRQAVISLAG